MNLDTHQKPADDIVGEALKAQRFHMLEDIAKDMAGEIIFPTCFDAIFHLRKALQDPDLPMSRIANLVSVEPLLASKLVQLANAARYGTSGPQIRSLEGAIKRLGVDLVRTTALTLAMGQLLRSKEVATFSGITQPLWKHSLQTAAAARIVARIYTRINPDEALLAGLVHDLGAFYMLYRAAQYPELRARPETVKYLMVQWHESIGTILLKALGLPNEIVEATIDHDQPRPEPETLRTLADIVYVSNMLAGSHFEWIHQDMDSDAETPGLVRLHFSELLPEIATDTEAMLTLFT